MTKSGSKCSAPEQGVQFLEFKRESLARLIDWHEPPLGEKKPRQLQYIAAYLEELGCRSAVIEDHYVDRDYMEDHATFYSKSLCSYPNSCKRAHFFTGGAADVKGRIRKLQEAARGQTSEEFRESCDEFSREQYLGFMVVRPLPGSPVGRTVLRGPRDADRSSKLDLSSSMRPYPAHLAGIRLEVTGLAFQQQDVGVSACATTAIWSSFQKIRDFEEVAAASPAQITMLAAKYSMPFGRAMPSEGLSIDQMCLAIQALGASPHLLRVEDYETARGYLYSIAASGMCCILVLRKCSNPALGHAVSMVGMRCRANHLDPASGRVDDMSRDLLSFLIHDDRVGPYLMATPENPRINRRPRIRLGDGGRQYDDEERWLMQILLPMHPKVRLSFGEIWDLATAEMVPMFGGIQAEIVYGAKIKPIQFSVRIIQTHTYFEELLRKNQDPTSSMINEISKSIAFSRYVGIVRLSSPSVGAVDVVMDTTCTLKNPVFLAVIPLSGLAASRELARRMGQRLGTDTTFLTTIGGGA